MRIKYEEEYCGIRQTIEIETEGDRGPEWFAKIYTMFRMSVVLKKSQKEVYDEFCEAIGKPPKGTPSPPVSEGQKYRSTFSDEARYDTEVLRKQYEASKGIPVETEEGQR